MIICVQCHVYIPDESLVPHMRWHDERRTMEENSGAGMALFEAHQENLIQRMYTAEKQIEALLARVHFLERQARGAPLGFSGDPTSHHHQME